MVGLIDELPPRNPDLDENLISDVVLGVVSPVGDQGADIARTAVVAAGMPDTVGGVQLNRFCASGLEAHCSPIRPPDSTTTSCRRASVPT